MTQAIETKNGTPGPVVADTILLVPLTEIYIDSEWNARSGNWQEDPAADDAPDGGFQGLLESLRSSGINSTPIELRPMKDKEKLSKGFKYSLVAGFRRCRVAQLLEWKALRALVKDMNDYEARLRNMQEGTAHSNLKTADLAWAVGDLKEKGGPKLTDKDIANALGLSQSYVSLLRRIQTDVKPTVTKKWRDGNLKVSVPDMMRLTVLPKEKHEEEFSKLTEGRNENGRTTQTPYVKLKERCLAKGRELGVLAQLKCLSIDKKGPWDIAVQELFHIPSSINAQQLLKLAGALADGYTEGLKAELKTAEKDEEDEKESSK